MRFVCEETEQDGRSKTVEIIVKNAPSGSSPISIYGAMLEYEKRQPKSAVIYVDEKE